MFGVFVSRNAVSVLQTTCSFIAVNPPEDSQGDAPPVLRPYEGSCKVTAVAKCCKQLCKHKLKHQQQHYGYGGYQQYAGYKAVGSEKKKVKKQKVVSAPVHAKKKVQTRKAYMGPADSP
jgi:hypothetical protein